MASHHEGGPVETRGCRSPGDPLWWRGYAHAQDRTGSLTQMTGTDNHWVVLISRIRNHGDQSAFAALFRHFAPKVKGFLMRSGTSEALAEEITQEVMATVWRKAAQFDPSRASVATWIFTIARNRRIDTIRRTSRPEPEDLPWGPEAEPDQAEVLALQQESDALSAALKELPAKQRDLIERAYFGEMTHTEIAADTGLPLGTVKSRIRLALDRLRQELDPQR